MTGQRMFVALLVPDPVRDDLADFLEPRRDADPRLRWTDPHQWHLTLAFLPTVSPAAQDELDERLAAVAARTAPFELRLAGAGAFPHPGAAKVLWLDVPEVGGNRDQPSLPPLSRRVRGAANAAGTTVDGASFREHVTLARIGRPFDVTRWLGVLQGYASVPWLADGFALVASHLGQGRGGRPRYETVATYPLTGPVRSRASG